MAKKGGEGEWVRICPKCKSAEVTCRGAITKDMVSPNWVCLTCGFQSPIFPEVNIEDPKFQELAKKLPRQSANFVVSRLPVTYKPFGKILSAILLGMILLIFLRYFLRLIGML